MNFSFATVKQKLMDYYTGEPLNSPRASTSKQPPSSRDKEQYDSLLPESEAEDQHMPLSRHRSSRRCSRSITFTVALLTFLAVLAVVNMQRVSAVLALLQTQAREGASISPGGEKETKPTGDELGSCGGSVEEARSLGCVFDPMSWAWQRPEVSSSRGCFLLISATFKAEASLFGPTQFLEASKAPVNAIEIMITNSKYSSAITRSSWPTSWRAPTGTSTRRRRCWQQTRCRTRSVPWRLLFPFLACLRAINCLKGHFFAPDTPASFRTPRNIYHKWSLLTPLL
ncbi:hypothetical protein F5Y10DRAFT_176459 [Nemania abortiva]|nr:hypothetical protein F5Y10DRAFT_176459 [Nemania abortiva]